MLQLENYLSEPVSKQPQEHKIQYNQALLSNLFEDYLKDDDFQNPVF